MTYLVVCIPHDMEDVPALLESWAAAGTSDTIVLNTARCRLETPMDKGDDVPILPSLSTLLSAEETESRTVLTTVADDAALARVVAAAQQALGDLSQPNTGILVALPVALALGLARRA